MIDRRTHDLMALSSAQSYLNIAMEGLLWARVYMGCMEGGMERVKLIDSLYEQVQQIYDQGLRETIAAEQEGMEGSDDEDL